MDLHRITLVCQDWGGLIGLRVAAEQDSQFARVVAANTGLPTGDRAPSEAFKAWLQFSQTTPTFDVGTMMGRFINGDTPESVIAAYDAPFPSEDYKAGARIFPALVPISPEDPAAAPNKRAWEKLKEWHKPFLTAFSDGDPITAGGDKPMRKLIPGAQHQAHKTIRNAGHFLQEEQADEFAQVVIDFIQSTQLQPA